jgi:hypothetical protein
MSEKKEKEGACHWDHIRIWMPLLLIFLSFSWWWPSCSSSITCLANSSSSSSSSSRSSRSNSSSIRSEKLWNFYWSPQLHLVLSALRVLIIMYSDPEPQSCTALAECRSSIFRSRSIRSDRASSLVSISSFFFSFNNSHSLQWSDSLLSHGQFGNVIGACMRSGGGPLRDPCPSN